jgi:hypothetical protein
MLGLWGRTGRLALLGIASLSGCVTQAVCEARVADARALGTADAAACVLAPEALSDPTCGGTDRSPALTYVAAWCEAVSLDCVRGQASAYATCFGGGPDTGLGAGVGAGP